MMEKLREGLWRLRQRLRISGSRPKKRAAPLKGNIQNVIVVKPENKMFSQAFFVLSDDYVRQSSLSSKELLRQAQEATGEYSGAIGQGTERGLLKGLLLVAGGLCLLIGTYWFIFYVIIN